MAAERALKELAPGGPAAAGLLSDGRWSVPGAATAVLGGGEDVDAEGNVGSVAAVEGDAKATKEARKAMRDANVKKYQEYFHRSQHPARLAAANRAANIVDGAPVDGYTVEVPAMDAATEEGVVPANAFGVASASAKPDADQEGQPREAAMDAYDIAEAALARPDAAGSSAVATVAIDLDKEHVDASAKEMMEQLKREADAYVNPQTGKALRWGDTWRHEWGGGVGVGRPESRPRRMMPDGTTQIMPAATDAGYALVPTSSDKRALEEFYDECNGVRWSVQRNWVSGQKDPLKYR